MAKKQIVKKKVDKHKLMTRVLAAVLAGLMVVGMATTLIWYLING